MRPKGYLLVTILLGLFSFSPLLSVGKSYMDLTTNIMQAVAVEVGLALTIFFWFRFTAARILIQLGYFLICMTFIDELRFHNQPPQTVLEWNVFIAQAIFGFFLFYWLNTKAVRTYCKERKLQRELPQPPVDINQPPIPEP